MYDLVIRNGTLVDGTGGERFDADVAIDAGRIVAIGAGLDVGATEIDAAGKLVTPGWVDIHTHYDAQVTWDPQVTPSSWHGVTTVVMGNCGVGFAPAAPERHDWLIGLMEGVEDIPGAALHEGIQWEWESFPAFLEALDKRQYAIDIAAQVPHGAVRGYVMGDRGAKNEKATPEDIAAMAEIVREGIAAGALGFSTSRTLLHKAIDGEYVPGTFASEDELLGIGAAMREAGGGVFQFTANHTDIPGEFAWMRKVSGDYGLKVVFNLLQVDHAPEIWRDALGELAKAAEDGLQISGQVAGRPLGVLMSWQGTAVPFLNTPSYLQLHQLPLAERMAKLADPSVRDAILADQTFSIGEFEDFILGSFDKMYRLGDDPNYEPEARESAAEVAERLGTSPRAVVYDWLMENDGKGIIYFPMFNYSWKNADHLAEMMQHPCTVLGLGDGGAHCASICDVSLPTHMLTFWTRDRTRGALLRLEDVVKSLTATTSALYGLDDRGVLAVGKRADLNIIDYDALRLHAPEIVYDLPAGGKRYVQRATGYSATIVAGEVVSENGKPTGALPGRLVKSQRARAAAAAE